MLTLTIHQLAAVSLVRSDHWLRYYLSSIYPPHQSLEKLAANALQDCQHHSEFPFRHDDVRSALANWSTDKTQQYSPVAVLMQLASECLDWQGNRFSVKPGGMDNWQRIISKIDPAWIVAAALLKRVNLGMLTEQQCLLLDEQDPQGFEPFWPSNQGKGVADNHVHLGGHGGHQLSMLNLALTIHRRPDFKHWAWHQDFPLINRREFDRQCMTDQYLDDDNHPDWNQFTCLGNVLLKRILDDQHKTTIDWRRPELWQPKPLQGKAALASYPALQTPMGRALFENSFRADQRWLYGCYFLLARHQAAGDSLSMSSANPASVQRAVEAFIHWSNIQRSCFIVSGVGLTHFVDFFKVDGRKFSQPAMADYKQVARQSDALAGNKREFKVSSGALVQGGRGKPINTYPIRKLVADLTQIYDQYDTQLAMHFVRDFSKGTDTGSSYSTDRKAVQQEVHRLQSLLKSPTLNGFAGLDNNRPVADFLRGFDVAGNENDLRIEVFAPSLRVLRGTGMRATAMHKPLRQAHFSIHAGEDYSHLLTGMRHIDETVQFCGFKPWDRIGHGLALGVDPHAWAAQQRIAYCEAGELLDNLVWAFHYAQKVVLKAHELAVVLPSLQSAIRRLSNMVWGESFDEEALFDAWALRRNCPVKLKHPPELNQEDWVPDYHRLRDTDPNIKSAVRLWQRYLNRGLSASERRDDRPEYARKVQIYLNDEPPLHERNKETVFYVSAAELDLYQAIQDWLIEDCSKKELVFEACPTSNIYIGRFQHYKQHPVFRWFPIKSDWLDEKYNRWQLRSGPLKVCVNTDDAGLMPTTIHNEHRILRDTAINHYHVAGEVADRWIDRLREIGVEAFSR